MEIEDRRRTIGPTSAGQQLAGQDIRKQAEVTAARSGNVLSQHTNGGQRDFDHPGTWSKREMRRVGTAVKIVPDRIDARTVAIALLREDLVRPGGAAADRECRRAIAAYGDAAGIFENPFAFSDI